MSNLINFERFDLLTSEKLECTTGGHSKWWSGYVCYDKAPDISHKRLPARQWVVFLEWGRIGLSGHREAKHFVTQHAAVEYFNGRVKDKLKKQYTSIVSEDDLTLDNKIGVNSAFETEWDLF